MAAVIATMHGQWGDSKENRLRKAQDKVVEIGMKMGLNQQLIDYGKNCYLMCSQKNLIQGRSVTVVAAVCLYIACRTIGPAPYLLIDFSDEIQENMYRLGQVYMHIV